jgi:hypothetical protein
LWQSDPVINFFSFDLQPKVLYKFDEGRIITSISVPSIPVLFSISFDETKGSRLLSKKCLSIKCNCMQTIVYLRTNDFGLTSNIEEIY